MGRGPGLDSCQEVNATQLPFPSLLRPGSITSLVVVMMVMVVVVMVVVVQRRRV